MASLIVTPSTSTELMHWGKKGMKWGVRRYQNEDGSLTEAGKKRYLRDSHEKGFKEYDESRGVYYKKTKKNREDNEFDEKRYVKEDITRTKNLTESGSRLTNEIKRVTDKSIKNSPKQAMDLSNMTDQELRNQINRAFLERQYNDLFNTQTQTAGRERVSKIMETAGDVLTVTGSVLGVALAIKELTGK